MPLLVTLSVAKGLAGGVSRCFAEITLSASEWAQHDRTSCPPASLSPEERVLFALDEHSIHQIHHAPEGFALMTWL